MKVLVADDDDVMLELMRLEYQTAPFEVVFCESGLDVLIAFYSALRDGKPFDALVLDCAFPHWDGFQIARHVRLDERAGVLSRRTKIGFFTAYDLTVEKSGLLEEVEADGYWRKDNYIGKLPEVIGRWLEAG